MPELIHSIRSILTEQPTRTADICESLPAYSSAEVLAVLHEGFCSGTYSFEIGRGWSA